MVGVKFGDSVSVCSGEWIDDGEWLSIFVSSEELLVISFVGVWSCNKRWSSFELISKSSFCDSSTDFWTVSCFVWKSSFKLSVDGERVFVVGVGGGGGSKPKKIIVKTDVSVIPAGLKCAAGRRLQWTGFFNSISYIYSTVSPIHQPWKNQSFS